MNKVKSISYLIFALCAISFFGCSSKKTDESMNGKDAQKRAKFEPEDGKILLFVGQELEAIGGTGQYHDGYYDHFDAPAGFTLYTRFTDEEEFDGLGAIYKPRDVGAGAHYMDLLTSDPDFDNSILAIGLSMVDREKEVAEGKFDRQISKLAKYLKSLGKRPVFLRIGFEFDGEWNHYDSVYYKKAYRHIKDKMESKGVENVAYIWQCTGWGASKEKLMNYYPGDGYVDWCSFSYFCIPEGQKFGYEPILGIARELEKPIFISESTPMLDVPANNMSSARLDFSRPEDAERAWNEWFLPYFEIIRKNKDVVKAIHYINCRWKEQDMWMYQTPFSKIDARLHLDSALAARWKEETSKEKYIKAYDGLFDDLWQ